MAQHRQRRRLVPLQVELAAPPEECGKKSIQYSPSVSWSASGNWLAAAGWSDKSAKLWDINVLGASSSSSAVGTGFSPREVASVAHPDRVSQVCFNPSVEALLCTAASAQETSATTTTTTTTSSFAPTPNKAATLVRLWDLRAPTNAKAMGTIQLLPRQSPVTPSVAWSNHQPTILALTESNGQVHVMDTRKISSNTLVVSPASAAATTAAAQATGGKSKTSPSSTSSAALVRSYKFPGTTTMTNGCIFGPSDQHLVAATFTNGVASLRVWNWQRTESGPVVVATSTQNQQHDHDNVHVYPCHTGPIYSHSFSPDGTRLATGAGDALVGLWDADTMVCTQSMARCTKLVRSVAFSHDSQLLATATEDDEFDVAMADTGESATVVGSSTSSTNNRSNGISFTSGRNRGERNAGADQMAFHPKNYVLACARCDSGMHPPVSIVRLKVTV